MTAEKTINAKRKAIERTLSGYPFPDFENLRDPANPKFNSEFTYALNFANYTYEHDDLKSYTQEYVEDVGINLSKIPDWEFFHIGIMAWLHIKGATLTAYQHAALSGKIASLRKKYDVVERVPVD